MSRLLANLIIAGGSMLVKAASQAYQKALVNAQRSGVAQEAAKGTAASVFGKKTMALDEARMILGIDAGATLEEAMARYQKMFEANEKASFYLQSKIHRAKERMEQEFGTGSEEEEEDGAAGDEEGDGGDAGGKGNPNAGRGFAASGVDTEDKPKQ
jgi:import inner membrane translocase subunit TIM16|tara:strand:- start:252 stop:719 length:468 start_codon:yes stop_codon:yes gene_type:complete|mmetsp:Transcript_4413/g.20032  ORF Transcript_4413/g.20032 Transcript_4413/m.20032 type:complete len:156 (+) Transcript_4413:43-510(+)